MVRFILKEPKSLKDTLIIMRVNINGKKVTISTGLLIHPNFWNQKKQRVKSVKEFWQHEQYTQILKDKKDRADKILLDHFSKTLFNPLTFRDLFINGDAPKCEGFIAEFEKYFKTLVIQKGYNNVKNKQTTINLIKALRKDWAHLTFDNIDYNFYVKFRDFCLYDKKYSVNTAGLMIKNIKTFLSLMYKTRQHSNPSYLEFKVLTQEVDKIYLSKQELKQLEEAELQGGLVKVRDGFLVQCYTGLRYSDLVSLKKSNIQNGYIKKITLKTGKEVVIPIHPVVQSIIDRYDGFPINMSNQKMNEYLKKVCEDSKLNRVVPTISNKGGQKVIIEFFVHQLVSTHTGRRTALTNMYLAGIDLLSICKISGHTTIKQLQTYLKIDSTSSAINLKDNPFFN